MHNNFYFLRQLSNRLKDVLSGFTLVSCFSQDKDELVIEFNNGKRSFFIKCSLLPDFQCLSFPDSFKRARKNSIDLFPELVMKEVLSVRQFNHERSFGLQLEGGTMLVFKMHGAQANVILFKGNTVSGVFRHHLPADLELVPDRLDRDIDWRENSFFTDPEGSRTRFVTFGKPVWKYLDDLGYEKGDPEKKWNLITEVKRHLENPTYKLDESSGLLKLTLLPIKNAVHSYDDPIRAINHFFPGFVSQAAFLKEKFSLLAAVRGRMKQCEAYLDKTKQRLGELENDRHYSYWADLVMANLHRISVGMKEVALEDFHEPGLKVVIKLKPVLTPQKNAEVFYRKAKNQAIEKTRLLETRGIKEKELDEWIKREQLVMAALDRRALDPFRTLMQKHEKEKERVALPYHEHTFAGYTVLVGKNADANDELTFHHAHKDDLWLHAKDVSGSHVLIRHQSGKKFPKDVIGFAASLAAYHSKRRNDSLCPVTVTQAKYVRKRKGDPPGMVAVQREDVVMAEPRKHTEM